MHRQSKCKLLTARDTRIRPDPNPDYVQPNLLMATNVELLTVTLQIAILIGCAVTIIHWLRRFPHPSLLVSPLLPPQKRWPLAQLRKWVDEGSPDAGFISFFMRDPERSPPPEPGLVAPVDGTVLALLQRDGRSYVVISLNVWDVHVARCPCSATVLAIRDHGDILEPSQDDPLRDEPFYFLRQKRSPKQRYLELDSEHGLMRVRLITSYLSRRIQFFCQPGQRLAKGERIGRMLFGSTCVLETDDAMTFSVVAGDRVYAGETLISTTTGQ
jgi:phosphatidylserine decarboxylase